MLFSFSILIDVLRDQPYEELFSFSLAPASLISIAHTFDLGTNALQCILSIRVFPHFRVLE